MNFLRNLIGGSHAHRRGFGSYGHRRASSRPWYGSGYARNAALGGLAMYALRWFRSRGTGMNRTPPTPA